VRSSSSSLARAEKLTNDLCTAVSLAAPSEPPKLRLNSAVADFITGGRTTVFESSANAASLSSVVAVRRFYATRPFLDGQLARLIFSASASSAAAERGFSVMNFIHTRLRTSMKEATLEKLVVIRWWLNGILERYPKTVGISDRVRLEPFKELRKKYVFDAQRRVAALALSQLITDPARTESST